MSRPTRAEINLDSLAFNFHSVKKHLGDVKYMAVVKADAYGHGAVECARRLAAEGADWFGVALPEEGIELRDAKITKPILCLGSFWAGQENAVLQHKLTPVLARLEIAEKLNRAAAERGMIADAHVKVDTGMNRFGVRWDALGEFVEKLKEFKNLRIDGVMTHFAAADADDDFTNRQIRLFADALALFRANGFRPTYYDLSNSPGALGHRNAGGNMVRLGGVLYGLCRDVLPKNIEVPAFQPVLSLRTKIALVKKVPAGETIGYSRTFTTARDSIIATIPIGYHDGLPRLLSNRGGALVGGKLAKIVGRVSMDWTLLDVTDVPNVKVDDEAVIIGEQNDARILTEDIAALVETISYEITCGISRRVPRVFRGAV